MDALLGPLEVRTLITDVEPHSDDLPFVEYTAGRMLAREETWIDNLTMLLTFRARRDLFGNDPMVDWQRAVERRDDRVRGIIRSVRATTSR